MQPPRPHTYSFNVDRHRRTQLVPPASRVQAARGDDGVYPYPSSLPGRKPHALRTRRPLHAVSGAGAQDDGQEPSFPCPLCVHKQNSEGERSHHGRAAATSRLRGAAGTGGLRAC